jgi:3-keto-5-aminohexanoate cleavage enzyme
VSQTPLIIEVRGNEFADRQHNAHIPYGAESIVQDALTCLASGASMYHWHGRGQDGIDRPDDFQLHQQVIKGIRASSDMVLHPTLGFTSTQGDAAGRTATVLKLNAEADTRIDVVPVDFGAIVADLWDEGQRRFSTGDKLLVNRTAYLEDLLAILKENSISVMAVVWSPGAVRTALRCRERGLLDGPTFWQLGFTGPSQPGGAPATERQLDAFLEWIPSDEPWTVHVREGDGLPMAVAALMRGGHVSIGLGDDPYDRLGRPDNQDLVRRVAQVAQTVGRDVASVPEARNILHLPAVR